MRRLEKTLLVLAIIVCGIVPSQGAETADPAGFDQLGKAVSGDDLDHASGRQGSEGNPDLVQLSETKSDGRLENNLLTSTTTGANMMGQNAMSNVNGIATVIQNSGNQVLIQNSMTLNLSVK